jgi:hypothetical protein
MRERGQANRDYCNGLFDTQADLAVGVFCLSKKRADTVGHLPSIAIGVSNMPSLKAKKLNKLPQGKVLLEL